jgi:hypothetical protein
MKYLVIARGGSLIHGGRKEKLQKAKEMLQRGMDSGKIEACYGLVEGGTAWVINADSHAALTRGLSGFHRAASHRLEVIPVVDGLGALDVHISETTK